MVYILSSYLTYMTFYIKKNLYKKKNYFISKDVFYIASINVTDFRNIKISYLKRSVEYQNTIIV